MQGQGRAGQGTELAARQPQPHCNTIASGKTLDTTLPEFIDRPLLSSHPVQVMSRGMDGVLGALTLWTGRQQDGHTLLAE